METHFDKLWRLTPQGKVIFVRDRTIEFTCIEYSVLSEKLKLHEVSFFRPIEGIEKLSEKAILNEKQFKTIKEPMSNEEMFIEGEIKRYYPNSVSYKVKTVNLGYTEDETNFIRERYVVIETQPTTNEEI